MSFVVILLLTICSLMTSCEQCKDSRSHSDSAVVGHVYKSFTTKSLETCYFACNTQPACKSLNFNLTDNTCEFNSKTKHCRPKDLLQKENFVYADNPDRDPWCQLNTEPVCFGAKNNEFGRFSVQLNGSLRTVKLVHLSGSVTCQTGSSDFYSNWGCGLLKARLGYVNVIITDAENEIVLPIGVEYQKERLKWYKIDGFDSFSSELIFQELANPYSVIYGQQLRVWYGEDLGDATEGDNDGTSCADVYALFV